VAVAKRLNARPEPLSAQMPGTLPLHVRAFFCK
jgi:hypothetical protein